MAAVGIHPGTVPDGCGRQASGDQPDAGKRQPVIRNPPAEAEGSWIRLVDLLLHRLHDPASVYGGRQAMGQVRVRSQHDPRRTWRRSLYSGGPDSHL